jgi:hypothetical protein
LKALFLERKMSDKHDELREEFKNELINFKEPVPIWGVMLLGVFGFFLINSAQFLPEVYQRPFIITILVVMMIISGTRIVLNILKLVSFRK